MSIFVGLMVKSRFRLSITVTSELGINGAAWATNLNFAIAALINIIFVKTSCGQRDLLYEPIKNHHFRDGHGWGYTSYVYVPYWYDWYGASVAVAIIVALAVYVLSLVDHKAIVKDDIYQMPVIGKRLRKRQAEENRIYEEEYWYTTARRCSG